MTGDPVPADRWIALLRGVNVGGVTIRSVELAEVFRSLGCTEVRTVLASGNVVFTDPGLAPAAATTDTRGALKLRIEQALADAFGYEAWIVLSHQRALADVVGAYPWAETEQVQPYVMFSSEQASLDALLAFAETAGDQPDRVSSGDGVLYWEVPKGSSTDTAFAKESSKARFKPHVTTRNLRTLRKLL
ncbi:DUF1697 domain-containing protein [Plantibacter sp. Leaf314]|uniref:DUF1697 domain-containing protein n=1 Tax=Plantibacter sp. Leaf314 TaxID=1736333 RepID=UPI0006F700B3|nr:DUF1697 domain-containing protein [Plantibacter sp. Leaf314]KQQ52002.1 hypothetical protein ASF68_06285 [Plantibacter sp. Leaf314]